MPISVTRPLRSVKLSSAKSTTDSSSSGVLWAKGGLSYAFSKAFSKLAMAALRSTVAWSRPMSCWNLISLDNSLLGKTMQICKSHQLWPWVLAKELAQALVSQGIHRL